MHAALDFFVSLLELILGEFGEAELLLPRGVDVARDAEADAAGEERRAADRAPHRDRDHGRLPDAERHRHPAFAEDPADGLARLEPLVIVRSIERALFEDDDAFAGFGERRGDDRSCGARTDDDDIASLAKRAPMRPPMDHAGRSVGGHAVPVTEAHDATPLAGFFTRTEVSAGRSNPVSWSKSPSS